MDQGVGVDHLQGAGHGQGFARVAPHRLRRGQTQNGTQPFSAHEQTVVYGLGHPEGRPAHPRQIRFQGPVDQSPPFLQIGLRSYAISFFVLVSFWQRSYQNQNETQKRFFSFLPWERAG
jgi:hypothetical protein